jgi:hypothetical protein
VIVSRVDHAEIAAAEARQMSAAFALEEADRLVGQRLADEDMRAAPPDRPVRPHAADLAVGVIPGLGEPLRHGALGRLVTSRSMAARPGAAATLWRREQRR